MKRIFGACSRYRSTFTAGFFVFRRLQTVLRHLYLQRRTANWKRRHQAIRWRDILQPVYNLLSNADIEVEEIDYDEEQHDD
jgi:hypothetical protein